jgi:hypothetical protein
MATTGTGFQAQSLAPNFMGLTYPVHLPTLTTNDATATTHLPAPQVTRAPEVCGYSDIPPERQGVDFGQQDSYKYTTNPDETLTGVTLCVQLDALVAAGGGANPRYPDDVLCQAIDHIDFEYGKQLQVIGGDRLHFETIQELDEKELARQSKLRGLGLSVAERIAKAQTARWYYLEVPFFWTRRDSDNWHEHALQRLTRVVIYWRTKDWILQQDNVNACPTPALGGCYMINKFLRFDVTCLTEGCKQEWVSRIQAQGDAGWLFMFPDTERLQQQLSTGATTSVILLNTFTKFGYNLRFVIRRVTALTQNYLHNRRFECLDITALTLAISGKTFLPPTDATFLKYHINNKLFSGNPDLAIYNIPFNDHPEMHSSAIGGFDFSNASNPQLTLYTAALPENCYIDFWLYCHNYIRVAIDAAGRSAAEDVQPL